ncbi:fumarylacetoacetate hydrolase family protein [Aurantimonas sp. Leaf443]|uniref:fumarylacetoacetate hydrolase family protein n=1 Tax=Aurantimonas sp. Leaf443 TaxID=1736378 RepID=UPI0006FA0E37|nr:fumarylacetoacetate hydrolase family protein [Aurantimonas sp. Leaf443]KQT83160.1 5-carboxymethyl-2-hydroxymuconate isomerase [Aurantimonas sp. Leaf443]
MSDFVFPPAPVTGLPVAGTAALFPVRRVYCVGRNYADHAREMGADPDREPPFFFQKNAGDLVCDGRFPYPTMSADVHHEVELVVALKAGGRDLDPAEALAAVFGYGVGLDMTRRDLQGEAKAKGRPWETGKAFAASAPVSALRSAAEIGHPARGAITLDVNGARRQSGDLSQMIWSVGEAIAHLSRLFPLAAGDVLMTGTPAGVGPVRRGDRLSAAIEGVGTLEVAVA